MPDLVYCGGGNARFVKLAVDAGMKYGARLPDTVYAPLYFADQNWKNPDRESYMNALKRHEPQIATVLDLEIDTQLHTVLDWAEEASQFVEKVIVIPNVKEVIKKIPKLIHCQRKEESNKCFL